MVKVGATVRFVCGTIDEEAIVTHVHTANCVNLWLIESNVERWSVLHRSFFKNISRASITYWYEKPDAHLFENHKHRVHRNKDGTPLKTLYDISVPDYVTSDIVYTEFMVLGEKTTVCLLKLENGFEVVGTSACIDPKNFVRDLGEKYAWKASLDKLEELDGFLRQAGGEGRFYGRQVAKVDDNSTP